MTSITKKKIKDKEYYYLGHTCRIKGKVHKIEKYLGTSIPSNIEEIKNRFIFDIYKERWFSVFEKIKTEYNKENKSMPISARDKELNSFMIKFTYDSQRIEGSKLTLRDTANLLERGITPREKPIRDCKEAEAHKQVFYEICNYNRDLSLQTVLYWHKNLFLETKQDIAGKIRNHGVAISGSRFTPPAPFEIQILIDEFFNWYEKNRKKKNPVELAAKVHLKFVTIHPFSDGNGRISRLMMNFVLNKLGYPMLDIPYENRNSYYNALEKSQTKGNELIFVQWFFKKYLKSNQRYLR